MSLHHSVGEVAFLLTIALILTNLIIDELYVLGHPSGNKPQSPALTHTMLTVRSHSHPVRF